MLNCTVGVHPHDAKTCNDSTIPELRKLAADPSVCAIGECGLDFDRMFSAQVKRGGAGWAQHREREGGER